MKSKLTWQQIERQFNHQWVQLINYDWAEGESFPSAGVVQFSSTNRKEFNELSKRNPTPDAARIYVGKVKTPLGSILSANSVMITPC